MSFVQRERLISFELVQPLHVAAPSHQSFTEFSCHIPGSFDDKNRCSAVLPENDIDINIIIGVTTVSRAQRWSRIISQAEFVRVRNSMIDPAISGSMLFDNETEKSLKDRQALSVVQ